MTSFERRLISSAVIIAHKYLNKYIVSQKRESESIWIKFCNVYKNISEIPGKDENTIELTRCNIELLLLIKLTFIHRGVLQVLIWVLRATVRLK